MLWKKYDKIYIENLGKLIFKMDEQLLKICTQY